MSEPFLGEIKMFGGNYAPVNWAFCNGQILSLMDYDALYSLLGSTYGGDGRVTFALPDMRGRVPIHFGTGVGLATRIIGQRFGVEGVTLEEKHIPEHTHNFMASSNTAESPEPSYCFLGTPPVESKLTPSTINFYTEYDSQYDYHLNDGAIEQVGEGFAHENRMPYLSINFIICMRGTYPVRGS